MLVGFDTEYGFHRHRRLPNGRLRGDESTLQPVCACLFFEDGREVRIADNFEQLQGYFDDPQYTFLVHGAHAEFGFCRRVGVHFPSQFRDTFLMGLLILHASEFCVPDGPYKNAALAELAPRYGIPFISAEDKDAIRQSIAQLNHLAEFGMARVLDYCLEDAKALIKIYPRLRDDMLRACGPNAESNLTELYQPYSLLMAEAGRKGLRFDQRGWDRLLTVTPLHRGRLLDVLRKYGYDHDGVGIGDHAFARLLRNIGLDADWPRTPGRTHQNLYRLSGCSLFRASRAAKDGFVGGERCRLTDRVLCCTEVGHGCGPNVGGSALRRSSGSTRHALSAA